MQQKSHKFYAHYNYLWCALRDLPLSVHVICSINISLRPVVYVNTNKDNLQNKMLVFSVVAGMKCLSAHYELDGYMLLWFRGLSPVWDQTLCLITVTPPPPEDIDG